MVSNGDESPSSASVLVSMQIQLGEIKGILNTIVTEHARRIGDTETAHRQLRFDLDSVKVEAKKDVADLSDKIYNTISKATEKGNNTLHELNRDITTNKNNVTELRSDITEVKEKQNAAWGKAVMILSPIAAFGALAWNVLGGRT